MLLTNSDLNICLQKKIQFSHKHVPKSGDQLLQRKKGFGMFYQLRLHETEIIFKSS